MFTLTDETLTLGQAPALVVGLGSEAAVPLDRVTGAVFFRDGVAVANSGSSEVLILDGAGNVVFRQGGRGSGPGEYMNLRGVVRRADGLLTWDASHSRFARLDSSGRYVGDNAARVPLPAWHYATMVGAFGNSVVVRADPLGFLVDDPVGPLEVRQDVHFVIANTLTGEVTFRIALPGQEQWAMNAGQQHAALPVTFGRTVLSAVTERGAYLADTDSLNFTRYDEAGNPAHFALETHRVNALEDWAPIVKDTMRARARMEISLRLVDGLPARTTLPSFSEMIGGADGHLWIREYPHPGQDQVIWVALNEDFEPQRRVMMPTSLRVLDFAENRVLALSKGTWGEDVIEVYIIGE